ncbi:hypothetical protein [Anaplasma capra]|uniref:hypothetical protein n=1 Tax=Anaplasma capra TaxID=1562740 RepID=UPI0021D59E4E|nr:hypothetical protein [Anaplasma capra]MCU7611290.1 hypothetical protein [Anaplasma capra]MCU7612719.1 hypothetical protein [Anaplasma capra]
MSFKINNKRLSAHIANPDASRYMRQGLGVTVSLSLVVVAALIARMWRLSREGMGSSELLKHPEFIALMVMAVIFIVSAIGLAVACSDHKRKVQEMNGLYREAAYVTGPQLGEDEDEERGRLRDVSFVTGSRSNPFSTPVAIAGLVTLTLFATLSGALPTGTAITADMIGKGFSAATPLQKAWVVVLFLAMAVTLFAAMKGGLLASGQGNKLVVVSSGGVSAADGILPADSLGGPSGNFDEVLAVHVHDANYRGNEAVNPFAAM